MEMHNPNIKLHGPIAEHDMSCPTCQKHKAVYVLNLGVFMPCWDCQKDGWRFVNFNAFNWVQKWILRKVF